MNIEKYTQNAQRGCYGLSEYRDFRGTSNAGWGTSAHGASDAEGRIDPEVAKYMNVDATAMIADVEEELEKPPRYPATRTICILPEDFLSF